jgi:hypothetical protein
MRKALSATTAFRFVLVIGIANLCADMTYEGGRRLRAEALQPRDSNLKRRKYYNHAD